MYFAYVLVLACLVVYVGGLVRFRRRCPRLSTNVEAPRVTPKVTVMVPARNEEKNIETCVTSILAQDYSDLTLIVVNDGSTDRTGEILRRLEREDDAGRLTILEGRSLPPGWVGKSNALDHASDHATGDWYLFMDADARLHPHAVSAAVAAVQEHGVTFLSAWPRQEVVGVWERIVQPVIVGVTLCANALRRISEAPFPVGLTAWAQFIFVDAATYEAVGGHASVHDSLFDDSELLARFREAGETPITLDGTDVVTVRMYRDFMDLWLGWTRIIFPSVGYNVWMIALALWWVVVISLMPVIGFVVSLLAGNATMTLAWLALVWLAIGSGWVSSRHVSAHPALGLNPIGGTVYVVMIVASVYRYTSGRGVTWKGRRYGAVAPRSGAAPPK